MSAIKDSLWKRNEAIKTEKDNLIFSICPECKAVRTLSGWVKVVEGKKIPFGLVEEICPSCALDLINCLF